MGIDPVIHHPYGGKYQGRTLRFNVVDRRPSAEKLVERCVMEAAPASFVSHLN